jgi:hypothetical protein
MNTTTDIITLTHNQIIRVKGFPIYTGRINVRTVEGFAKELGRDPAERLQRAIEHGHELAWTIQATAVLTDDYEGKQADLDAERAKIEAAVEIENGQPVIIEGRHYTVKVNGQQFSDPVAFIPDTRPL